MSPPLGLLIVCFTGKESSVLGAAEQPWKTARWDRADAGCTVEFIVCIVGVVAHSDLNWMKLLPNYGLNSWVLKIPQGMEPERQKEPIRAHSCKRWRHLAPPLRSTSTGKVILQRFRAVLVTFEGPTASQYNRFPGIVLLHSWTLKCPAFPFWLCKVWQDESMKTKWKENVSQKKLENAGRIHSYSRGHLLCLYYAAASQHAFIPSNTQHPIDLYMDPCSYGLHEWYFMQFWLIHSSCYGFIQNNNVINGNCDRICNRKFSKITYLC